MQNKTSGNDAKRKGTVNREQNAAGEIRNELKSWGQSGLQGGLPQFGIGSISETDHGSTVGSFSSPDIDRSSRFSVPNAERLPIRNTSAKDRQRRISVAVVETLRAEGKKGSDCFESTCCKTVSIAKIDNL